MTDQLFEQLKAGGHRLTAVRKCMIALLVAYKKPLDAGTIQAELVKALGQINKTTVYREIEFLLSQSLVRQVDFGEGKKRYEISSLPHHHHLVCVNCKTVKDVRLKNDLKPIEQAITRASKFKIQRHALEFFGLCPQCATS